MSWVVLLALLQQPTRPYWPVTVDELAGGHVVHTHVAVTGRVRLVRMEADGDRHIKLTGVRAFIVAECIPALGCPAPTVGQRIQVRGIARFDAEHHWWEVHPVEAWTPAR